MRAQGGYAIAAFHKDTGACEHEGVRIKDNTRRSGGPVVASSSGGD